MSTKNDGGPAFPGGHAGNENQSGEFPMFNGMSLRDWFAGKAMNRLLAEGEGDPRTDAERKEAEAIWNGTHDESAISRIFYGALSRHAYMAADAMLAEREREG